MRTIVLQVNDYALFDTELGRSEYEYFRGHIDTFKRMFYDQGEEFWLNFITCFRWFHVEYGFIKAFPASSAEYGAILEEGFSYIRATCTSRRFPEVKNYIHDVAIMAKNKSHVHHLESKFNTKDPFYFKETREVFRKLFGEPKSSFSRLRVYCQFDLHTKFAGALVQCLKRWQESSDQNPRDVTYWSKCASKKEVDLVHVCSQPGTDKLELDYDRYEKELETSHMLLRKMSKCTSATATFVEDGITYKPYLHMTPDVLIQTMEPDKRKELDDIAREFYKDYVPRDGSVVIDDNPHTVELVMFINERLQGKEDGPVLVGSWPEDKDPRFFDRRNPLYDPAADPAPGGDWRTDLDYGDFLRFLAYVGKTYGDWKKMPESQKVWDNTEAPCIATVASVMGCRKHDTRGQASGSSSRPCTCRPPRLTASASADNSTKAKESGFGKKKKTRKEIKREKKKMATAVSDILSVPGLNETVKNVSHNAKPIQITETITDRGDFQQVELVYETDFAKNSETRTLRVSSQTDSGDAKLDIHQLLENVPRSVPDQATRNSPALRNIRTKEVFRPKELPVLNAEAEKKIIESLAKQMGLTQCSDSHVSPTKKKTETCSTQMERKKSTDSLGPERRHSEVNGKRKQTTGKVNNDQCEGVKESETQISYTNETKTTNVKSMDLANDIPLLASKLGIPISDLPKLKLDTDGKPMKTELHTDQVIKTLLSGDSSKYIEVSTFSEPGAPQTKFLVDIPQNPNDSPKYRYCDPHKNRIIVGPLRHNFLFELLQRHKLMLCPRDGEMEKDFFDINPEWISGGTLMLTDTPENEAQIAECVLNCSRMPNLEADIPIERSFCVFPKEQANCNEKLEDCTNHRKGLRKNIKCLETEKLHIHPHGYNDCHRCSSGHASSSATDETQIMGKTKPIASHQQVHMVENSTELNAETSDQLESNQSLRLCSYCSKEEPSFRTYKKCQRCKELGVGSPRYYCGKDCQVKDWKEKHKKEHKDMSG